jgi:hypothetical protein
MCEFLIVEIHKKFSIFTAFATKISTFLLTSVHVHLMGSSLSTFYSFIRILLVSFNAYKCHMILSDLGRYLFYINRRKKTFFFFLLLQNVTLDIFQTFFTRYNHSFRLHYESHIQVFYFDGRVRSIDGLFIRIF